MFKLPRWLPWVAAAALLLWQRDCANRQAGALQAEITAAHRREAELAEHLIVYDTTFITDTLHLTKWHTRYDTLVNNLPDSLKDAPPIKEIVQAADSTIHACSVALLTCDQRVAVRDSLIGNLKQQLGLEKKKRPGRFGCAAGVAVNLKGVGPGAACGLRF